MSQSTATRAKNQPKMTEAEAAHLRTLVPDDPIKLPDGHLACEGCGIAVISAPVTTTTPADPVSVTGRALLHASSRPVKFGRCAACQTAHEQAQAYVAEHPSMVAALGDLAAERAVSTILALTLLGRPVPADLNPVMARLQPIGHTIWFSSPLLMTEGRCNPHPWAHVTLTQRADLRTAYGQVLQDRLLASAPPVALPCPRFGCLYCGVSVITRPAAVVTRMGGARSAAELLWKPVTTSRASLGGTGRSVRWDGTLCPDCTTAYKQSGAIGLESRAQALVSFIAKTDPRKAERLRDLVESKYPPQVPGWGAVYPEMKPSTEPWTHMRRFLSRL